MPTDERFEEFYGAVFGRLVGQLFLVTGDLHDAEDAVQEALTRAAARWGRLREYEVPEAWVRRVAMNLASDGFRRARRRLAVAVRLRPGGDADPPTLDGLAVTAALRDLPLAQPRAPRPRAGRDHHGAARCPHRPLLRRVRSPCQLSGADGRPGRRRQPGRRGAGAG